MSQEKEQEELHDLLKYNVININKSKSCRSVNNPEFDAGKRSYDNKLINDNIKKTAGKFKKNNSVYITSFEDKNKRAVLFSNKDDSIKNALNNEVDNKVNTALFNIDFIRENQDDLLKAGKLYCNIKSENIDYYLSKNLFLNESVGLFTNLYYDIEFNKEKSDKNPNILIDFCEAIEKDFLTIFDCDISKLRIVLTGGFKEKKNEYSYHIIYKISEINKTFKYNHNQRIFTYIGKNFNAFKEQNDITLSFTSGNNFVDFVVYDKERFIRCINQSKIKDVNNKDRYLSIDKELTTFNVKDYSDTLINTTVFHTPSLYKKYEELEGYENLDDRLSSYSYKAMKDSINGVVGGKYPWIKDFVIVKKENIIIESPIDFIKHLNPMWFKYETLIKIMWSFKAIGGKQEDFQNFINPVYKGSIEQYWLGFKLNEHKNKFYNRIVAKHYAEVEAYLICRLESNICNKVIDNRFIEFYKVNNNNNNNNEINIITKNTSIKIDNTIYVSDYMRFFSDTDLTEDTTEKNKTNIVIVKSPLGGGKTFQFMKSLKYKYGIKESDKKTLIISPRRTFTKDLEKRLNDAGLKVWSYLNIVKREATKPISDFKYNLEHKDIFIISLESLSKYFCSYTEEDLEEIFDFLICDEIESIYNSFVKNDRDTDIKTIRKFCEFVGLIKNILFLDGMITKKTMDLLNLIRLNEQKTYFVNNNICPSIIRNFEFFNSEDDPFNSLYLETQALLLENKKVFIYFNVKKHLNRFQKLIEATFNNTDPKKILKFTGDIDDKEAVKNIKSEEWGEYDLIISTSTLSCGVDFNERGVFEKSLCFISGEGCNMSDIIQGLLRVRRFNDNNISIYFNKRQDEEDFNYVKEKEEYNNMVLSKYDIEYIEEKTDIAPEDFIKEIFTNQKIEQYFKKHKSITVLKYLINLSCNTYSGGFYGREKLSSAKGIKKLHEKLYDMRLQYPMIVEIENEKEFKKTFGLIQQIKKSINKEVIDDVYFSKLNFTRFLYERLGKYILQKKLKDEDEEATNEEINKILNYNWDNYYIYRDVSYKIKLVEKYVKHEELSFSYCFYENNNLILGNQDNNKNFILNILKPNFDRLIKKKDLDKGKTVEKVSIPAIFYKLKEYKKDRKSSYLSILLRELNLVNRSKNMKFIVEKLLRLYYGKTYLLTDISEKGETPDYILKKATEEDIEEFEEDQQEKKIPKACEYIELYVGENYNRKDFTDFDFDNEDNIFKIYVCEDCSETLNCKKSYEEHKALCQGIICHACPRCEEQFILKSILQIHKKTCNCEYTCEDCCKTYIYKSKYDEHMYSTEHANNLLSRRTCHTCNTLFETREEYKNHTHEVIEVIEEEEEKEYWCEACDYCCDHKTKFDRHTSSKTHLKKVEKNTKETYKCETCDCTFKHKTKYDRHMTSKKHLKKVEKNTKETYKCETCDCSFDKKKVYNRHMKSRKHLKNLL